MTAQTLRYSSARSSEKPLPIQPPIQGGDVVAVAVEQLRGHAFVTAEHAFGRLAPARVRHLGVDVGPEAILRWLDRLPESHRPLIGKGEAAHGFDRLEAVLPGCNEAQRRAILAWHRLAVEAGRDESELVRRFRHGQPFDVGPGIPALALARRHLGIHEGLHAQVAGAAQRAGELYQRCEGKAAPGYGHRPGLDAAMPVEALLEGHAPNELVRIEGELLLDHAVDDHAPGLDWKRLRRARDLLVRAELVEVVVAGRPALLGERTVEPVGVIAPGRVEIRPRIRRRLELGLRAWHPLG